MHSKALAIYLLFVAPIYGAAEPAPYMIGSMSINPAFGLAKRQAGYQPTQTYCGPGADCATSCGQGYIQCASNDNSLHCFDPAINETCCPDGTGSSCSDGYYCTKDTTGNTWCCPNGLSLSACAAAYSLTDTLVSETSPAAPTSSSGTTSLSVSVSASVTTSPNKASTSTSQEGTVNAPTGTTTGSLHNGSLTSSSPTGQFTGGANAQTILGGLPGLVLAAGAFFL